MVTSAEAVHGNASPVKKSAFGQGSDMSYSLDTPSVSTLKSEARALREERAKAGSPIGHSAALEEVAHQHGYRDWNTAAAALPQRVMVPVQVGQRVRGTYLSQPFTGLVMSVKLLADMQHYEVSVHFDQPVNVWKGKLAVALRQRVRSTVDMRGVSLAHTSDGEPQMRIGKI